MDKIQPILYFAYGSNMSVSRLKERVGSVKKVGTTKIDGLRLVFNCGYIGRSFANVVEDESASVEGVLYELDDDQIALLDLYEGYPVSYQKFFLYKDDKIIFGYRSVNPRFASVATPEPEYFGILKRAARHNELWDTYSYLAEYEAAYMY